MTLWKELSEASPEEILAWAETQPWAEAMAACKQDTIWHAEGDVWTHTRMVYAKVLALNEWASLDHLSRITLLFTALLHDSGKPATSRIDPETGHLHSPKHSLVGAGIARSVLRSLHCDLEVREAIVGLVRYHGRPPYLMEKAKPEQEVIGLSCQVSNRLLYLFALADTRGRLTREMDRPEENLHLWKLVAEEQNCFEQPYGFTNDHARFLFYRDALSSLHYEPREAYRCTATLMAGLPGAGKDTWLARHHPALPVVSLDAIRQALQVSATDNQGKVVQTAREQCRVHMRKGENFAFNATNLTRQTRQRWINLFADYGARVEIIYLEPALETILSRNKQRDRVVPESVILEMIEKMEVPSITEAHTVRLSAE